jgi:hypothetical protein
MKNFFNLNKKGLIIPALLFLALTVAACADVTNIDACLAGTTYGFWGGLWHGIIAPVSFIASVFFDDIAMYAVNNSGSWYDFGFVLGAGILFGGGSRAAK